MLHTPKQQTTKLDFLKSTLSIKEHLLFKLIIVIMSHLSHVYFLTILSKRLMCCGLNIALFIGSAIIPTVRRWQHSTTTQQQLRLSTHFRQHTWSHPTFIDKMWILLTPITVVVISYIIRVQKYFMFSCTVSFSSELQFLFTMPCVGTCYYSWESGLIDWVFLDLVAYWHELMPNTDVGETSPVLISRGIFSWSSCFKIVLYICNKRM